MPDDQQLLSRFAENRSEAAFGELVSRYVNLVYSTALRRTDFDAHLAQDVAQLVFTDLARKAPSLSRNVVLAGWLHRATLYAAGQMMRSDRRRRWREQEAAAMSALESETNTDWQAIRPALDEALDRLNQTDRDALLLRFFEQRSLAEIGSTLGTNEDAAGKRVKRALEKLRAMLLRRGITTTGAALSAVISTHAVQMAPVGLAVTLTGKALAAAGATSGITATLFKIMALTKTQLTLGGIAIAVLTASLMVEQGSQRSLRRENEALQRKMAQLSADHQSLADKAAQRAAQIPRLPAPAIQVSNAAASDLDTLQSTNLYGRLINKDLTLKPEQLEGYLRESGRNADSLLAAYRTMRDPALLAEAKRNFPNDPHVAFEAALEKDITPEDQRKWLDVWKKADPDNAEANYISALNYFKTGQTDQAVKEFTAAIGKPFDDYTSQRYEDDTEAYLAAGYSMADAKAGAGFQLLLPQLLQTKNVGLDMIDLAKTYQQNGDSASAQAALQMVINLGTRYSTPFPGEPVISELVGLALQRYALKTMDPTAAYGNAGQTVQDQITQVQQQYNQITQRSDAIDTLLPQMSEEDWIVYRDRWMTFGEQNAGDWILSKFGKH
jgi:RNA polymerase sigma factor (sigma-70 family)